MQVESQGGYGNIDGNFTISNNANNHNFPMGTTLVNLDDAADRALECYYLISPAVQNPEISKLSAFTSEFENILDDLKQAKANAKRDATHVQKMHAQVEAQLKSATDIAQKITALHEAGVESTVSAKAKLSEIVGVLAEINEKVQLIEETYNKSVDLFLLVFWCLS